MKRIKRITICPGCNAEVVVPNSRPGVTAPRYCAECKSDPLYNTYRRKALAYGLTFKESKALLEVNECECCGKTLIDGEGPGHGANNKRQIDHCHNTGKVRGILCWSCNTGIGHLGDTVEGLTNALRYLNKEEE